MKFTEHAVLMGLCLVAMVLLKEAVTQKLKEHVFENQGGWAFIVEVATQFWSNMDTGVQDTVAVHVKGVLFAGIEMPTFKTTLLFYGFGSKCYGFISGKMNQSWDESKFDQFVNVSLNYLISLEAPGPGNHARLRLEFRTLFEKKLEDIVYSDNKATRKVKKGASKGTTEADPFVRFPVDISVPWYDIFHWHRLPLQGAYRATGLLPWQSHFTKGDLMKVMGCVMNNISEHCSMGYIDRDVGTDVVAENFIFGLTFERYDKTSMTTKLRVMVIKKSVLERINALQGLIAAGELTIEYERPHHADRWRTLLKMAEHWANIERTTNGSGIHEPETCGDFRVTTVLWSVAMFRPATHNVCTAQTGACLERTLSTHNRIWDPENDELDLKDFIRARSQTEENAHVDRAIKESLDSQDTWARERARTLSAETATTSDTETTMLEEATVAESDSFSTTPRRDSRHANTNDSSGSQKGSPAPAHVVGPALAEASPGADLVRGLSTVEIREKVVLERQLSAEAKRQSAAACREVEATDHELSTVITAIEDLKARTLKDLFVI